MKTVQSHNLVQSIMHAQHNTPNTRPIRWWHITSPAASLPDALFNQTGVTEQGWSSRWSRWVSHWVSGWSPWTHCHAHAGAWRNWYHWLVPADLPWLNLTEHTSFCPMSPGCTSERPGAQWCWSRSGRRSSIGSSGARSEVLGHAYEHVEAIQTTERHFEFLDLSWTLWIQPWRLISFMKRWHPSIPNTSLQMR